MIGNEELFCQRVALPLDFSAQSIHGGLPERPMGGDCKSPGDAFEGSNPSPATSIKVFKD